MSGGVSTGMPFSSAPSDCNGPRKQNFFVETGRCAHHMWNRSQLWIELPPIRNSLLGIFCKQHHVRGCAQQTALQRSAESVVDGDSDHQRHDAGSHADNRDHSDDRNNRLLALGAQIAAGDKQFKGLSAHCGPSLRSKQREQNYVANGARVGQDHGEPVDTDAFAARRRHGVRERAHVIFVHLVRLFISLFDAARAASQNGGAVPADRSAR